jgi:hypothetical protein
MQIINSALLPLPMGRIHAILRSTLLGTKQWARCVRNAAPVIRICAMAKNQLQVFNPRFWKIRFENPMRILSVEGAWEKNRTLEGHPTFHFSFHMLPPPPTWRPPTFMWPYTHYYCHKTNRFKALCLYHGIAYLFVRIRALILYKKSNICYFGTLTKLFDIKIWQFKINSRL